MKYLEYCKRVLDSPSENGTLSGYLKNPFLSNNTYPKPYETPIKIWFVFDKSTIITCTKW